MSVPRRTAMKSSAARGSFAHDTAEGFRIAFASPTVRVLLILAVTVEVFAFSYQSLLPSFADRVLHVGATGLGALTFGTGLGAVVGVLALTRLIETRHRGRLMCGVTVTFALALLGLASTDVFLVAVALLVVVGAMAAMFDALQWALLQSTVPDEVRGRVIGLWMTAIGFGWLGPVILGGIAEVAGTSSAIALGGAVALIAALAAFATPRLRRL
jgi:predicted MFS family arabinose efflux permease